jgi:hypothetical protein
MKKVVMMGLVVLAVAAMTMLAVGCTSDDAKTKTGPGTVGKDTGKTTTGPGDAGKPVAEDKKDEGAKPVGLEGPDKPLAGGATVEKPVKAGDGDKKEEGAAPTVDEKKEALKKEMANETTTPVTRPKDAPAPVKSYSYTLEAELIGGTKLKVERKVDGDDRSDVKLSNPADKDWKETSEVLNDGKSSYILNPTDKTGRKTPLDKDQAANTVPKSMLFVPKWDNYLYEKPRQDSQVGKLGADKVNGVETTKYKIAPLPDVANIAYVWVDKEGLVRKIEGRNAEGYAIITINVEKIDLNAKFAETAFAPPSGYTITDLAAEPAGEGKAPLKKQPAK